MAERKLNFINAGDQDVSEVTISTGTEKARPADAVFRQTYTVSYPGGGGGGGNDKNNVQPLTLEQKFIAAAKAIEEDATQRGVTPGEP